MKRFVLFTLICLSGCDIKVNEGPEPSDHVKAVAACNIATANLNAAVAREKLEVEEEKELFNLEIKELRSKYSECQLYIEEHGAAGLTLVELIETGA